MSYFSAQESMMDFVYSAFEDADVIIYMIEVGEKGLRDQKLFENAHPGTDLFAIDNKYISITPITPDLSLTSGAIIDFSQKLIDSSSINRT